MVGGMDKSCTSSAPACQAVRATTSAGLQPGWLRGLQCSRLEPNRAVCCVRSWEALLHAWHVPSCCLKTKQAIPRDLKIPFHVGYMVTTVNSSYCRVSACGKFYSKYDGVGPGLALQKCRITLEQGWPTGENTRKIIGLQPAVLRDDVIQNQILKRKGSNARTRPNHQSVTDNAPKRQKRGRAVVAQHNMSTSSVCSAASFIRGSAFFAPNDALVSLPNFLTPHVQVSPGMSFVAPTPRIPTPPRSRPAPLIILTTAIVNNTNVNALYCYCYCCCCYHHRKRCQPQPLPLPLSLLLLLLRSPPHLQTQNHEFFKGPYGFGWYWLPVKSRNELTRSKKAAG